MSILSRIFGGEKPVKPKKTPADPKARSGTGAAIAAHSKDAKSFGKSGQNPGTAAKKP